MEASSTDRLRSQLKRLVPRALAIRRLRHSQNPAILLTFDDGPHPEITPAVLDRLARNDARAVFFVVGRRVKRAAHVLERIRSEGHIIGNHTYLHRARYASETRYRAPRLRSYYGDCARCQDVIASTVGEKPHYFRPPGGRLTLTTTIVPRLLGLQSVIWSRYVKDWTFQDPAEARAGAAELLQIVSPQDILLLHDSNRHVLDLLDVLLPELRRRGYDLVSGIELL